MNRNTVFLGNSYKTSLVLFLLLFLSCKTEKKQDEEHAYTNALIDETSPYLLQHAHNPVNWVESGGLGRGGEARQIGHCEYWVFILSLVPCDGGGNI